MRDTGTAGISAGSRIGKVSWALQGEFVEARQNGTVLDRGWVDMAAWDLGVLRIVSSATGIRRMPVLQDCGVRVLPEPSLGHTEPR